MDFGKKTYPFHMRQSEDELAGESSKHLLITKGNEKGNRFTFDHRRKTPSH
jgi:hypothetical protein